MTDRTAMPALAQDPFAEPHLVLFREIREAHEARDVDALAAAAYKALIEGETEHFRAVELHSRVGDLGARLDAMLARVQAGAPC